MKTNQKSSQLEIRSDVGWNAEISTSEGNARGHKLLDKDKEGTMPTTLFIARVPSMFPG